MLFSIAASAVLASFGLQGVHAGRVETVTINDLTINKVGSPVGTTIPSISFILDREDTTNFECTANDLSWPESSDIFACSDPSYSFLLWPGEKTEFGVMIYHDVGDAKADLRGGVDVDTECDNSGGSGPADELCTQKASITFTIDGPVGN